MIIASGLVVFLWYSLNMNLFGLHFCHTWRLLTLSLHRAHSNTKTILLYQPPRDKTNKMACAPSEDSDQPGHPPSLIRVFALRMKKAWVLSYPLSAQRRLWLDWADAQADMSLRWAHIPFCWFCHEAVQLRCRSYDWQLHIAVSFWYSIVL